MRLGELAFRIGRRIGKHPTAGWLFCLTERLLPLKRIAREHGLVAFHHPRPIANPHVLIVPTRPVPSLTSNRLTEREMSRLIWSMCSMAKAVAAQVDVTSHWRLVINGGARQDIGQLHGHLLPAREDLPGEPLVLGDPDADFSGWQELLLTLQQASNVANSGYSLIFQRFSEDDVQSFVTETTYS